jgi:hypothetical protein
MEQNCRHGQGEIQTDIKQEIREKIQNQKRGKIWKQKHYEDLVTKRIREGQISYTEMTRAFFEKVKTNTGISTSIGKLCD